MEKKTSNGYIAFLDLNSNKNVHFKNEYTAIIYSHTIQIHCHFWNVIQVQFKYVDRVSVIVQVYRSLWLGWLLYQLLGSSSHALEETWIPLS